MAPSISKLAVRNSAIIAGSMAAVYYISMIRLKKGRKKAEVDEVSCAYAQKADKRRKVQVDKKFFGQLGSILKIILPGLFSREAACTAFIALTLFGRTMCDIYIIHNSTVLERSIITKDVSLFSKSLEMYLIILPVISLVNNAMKYGLNELRLLFRSRLTNHLYSKYLSGITYYQMSNIDSRISNPDQLLTQDVDKFCTSVVNLYSNVSKPLLDSILMIKAITSSIGPEAPSALLVYLVISGAILTRLRRPNGSLVMTEQQLEGELRYVNSRIITNSEEVAFYRGHLREKSTLLHAFQRLLNHLRMAREFNFAMGYVDNIIAKYFASIVGFLIISRPFLTSMKDGLSYAERLECYYKSGRMFLKLAEAIGRLIMAGQELTKLAGFTARIVEIMNVLNDLNKGKYVRTMVNKSADGIESTNAINQPNIGRNVVPGAGKIVNVDNVIRFEKVPLVTPNGDILIESMSFEVKSGMNVLVHGPNGCGKSSLFRVLGELWPLFGGKMVKPAKNKLFYIPQRPYMTLGTLRDQIIYPDSLSDMRRKGISDGDLDRHLELVQLNYVLEREGSWDTIKDWMDILSGGEKQRVAMARLFYHKPQFAILDECTSAVSLDVEGSMYRFCRESGITLFTVSHRKSLWQYHEYMLDMDGRGEYSFKIMTDDETVAVES